MQDKQFKLVVNDDLEFKISELALDMLDIVSQSENKYHLIDANQSIHAEVLYSNLNDKEVEVRIDEVSYKINIADSFDQLVDQMGFSQKVVVQVDSIKAPMPGLVLDLFVEPGQVVKMGDKLLILEAMKMENVIKAPIDCIVKSVDVSVGDSVEKGLILIGLDQ